MTALIEVSGLCAGYNGAPVLHDLNLTVNAGEVVALLGANGAGKTTALLAISGAMAPLAGEVRFSGGVPNRRLDHLAREGMALITDDRAIFRGLTVQENLELGRGRPDDAVAAFPDLKPLLKRKAGLLSGGEQQMLSIGRALASRPKVLLADEVSQGLAPIIVSKLLRAVQQAARDGAGVLLVEQHVRLVLDIADRAYVLQRGEVSMSGTSEEIRAELGSVEAAYLSASG